MQPVPKPHHAETDGAKTDNVEIASPDEIKDARAGKKQLDEGLEESMDGSDPPSALQP
jgi:hypothetical protein